MYATRSKTDEVFVLWSLKASILLGNVRETQRERHCHHMKYIEKSLDRKFA